MMWRVSGSGHSQRKLAVPLVVLMLAVTAALTAAAQSPPRLLLAFSSYRDRPRHAKVFFYEHDGVGNGTILGTIEPVNERQDTHPSLTADGKLCAFSLEQENQPGGIGLWDLAARKLIDPGPLNESPNALMGPSVSADGKLIAFSAWSKPGLSARWDLLLFDLATRKPVDLPGVNTQAFDERAPSLSGDGRWLAFVSNAPEGAGGNDIHLLDRSTGAIDRVPALNSTRTEVDPALSSDGRWLAFVSDRPGGAGGRDIYLFDLQQKHLVPLPGLNSVAHEQSPSLTADGRYLAYVSERIGGAGERDVYLYDRQLQKLVPTPGLNAKAEDLDPCVVEVR